MTIFNTDISQGV